MNAVFSFLPWLVSLLAAAGIIGMQCIGGGGRPMFPLLACYLPVIAAGLLALPITLFRRESREPERISLISMVLLGGYILVRTLFGGDPGLRDFELLRLGGMFLLYLVFAVVVTGSRERLFFLLLILLSAFFQTAIELYQFYCDRSWGPLPLIISQLQNYYPTSVGTYANKNHLAWLLGDATLFALALGCWGRLRWTTRGLVLYCAAFCSLGVFLSMSRGGVLALIVGTVVLLLISFYLLVSSGNHTALLSGSIGALVLCLLGFAVGGVLSGNLLFQERMQRLWMDVFREDLWRAAIHDLGLAPYFGMGAGSFQWSARLMMPHESLLAHNDFAQLLSEYGLIGLLLTILFLGAHLRSGGVSLIRGHRAVSESTSIHPLWSNKGAIVMAAIAVAVTQITHSFLDFNMHLGANALLAGVCFGLLCNPGLRRMRHDAHANWSRWVRWGSSVMIAALTLSLALNVVGNWRSERWIFAAESVSSSLSKIPPSAEQLSSAIESAFLACEAKSGADGSARHAAVLGSLLWFRITQQAYTQDQLLGESRGVGEGTERDLSRLAVALRRAIAADPGDWFARMRLGGVLARIGDESGSRGAFVGAMQRLPLYALTYQEYAASLRDFGSLDEARHYYLVSNHFKDAGSVSRTLKDLEKLLRVKSFEASRESGTKSGRAREESVPVLK
jgi:O-antigen ligase